MSQTPLLKIPELYQGQAAFAFHNAAIRDLEVFASGGAVAISDSAPINAVESVIYIVAGANATGAFTGKENHIAQFRNSAWKFFAPVPGLNIWCQDINNFRYWYEPDSAWRELELSNQGVLLAANNLAELQDTSLAIANLGAIPVAQKGVSDGVATLGSDGLVPSWQLPAAADATNYIVSEAIASLPYTLVEADHGKNKIATGTGTINIPDNFPTGWYCNLILDSTGDLTINAVATATIKFSGGATANHLKKENAAVTIVHEGGNVWRVFGANER